MKIIQTMRKIVFLFTGLTCSFLNISAQELKSEILCDLDANLDAPLAVGPTLNGTRVIFPVVGGTVKRPKIKMIGTCFVLIIGNCLTFSDVRIRQ